MSFDPESVKLSAALLHWLIVFGSFIGMVLAVALLTSLGVARLAGPRAVCNRVRDGAVDLSRLSCTRIWALAMLTWKEAIRRKALMVFVIFAALFMFAGWFLSDTNARPDLQAKVHISFVLTAVTWLVMPVVLLLSCWGLPEDIKARSLHTVVTKPARRSEIVIGRMLGFVLVGTLVLVIMSAVGYVWIERQMEEEPICRVPVYGSLSFLDREGKSADKGINVGDIWEFRSYIEGATKSSAIWEFEGMGPDSLDKDGTLKLESRFEAFRTHKGVMGEGLLCRLSVEKGDLRVPLETYPVREFSQNIIEIPRKLHHEDKDYDLIDDLVEGGKLHVTVQCLDAGQYLGMARPDLFVRMPDQGFATGYSKAVFGIWLMLVLVVVLSVSASCFAKGPVATLLTGSFIVIGLGFRELMDKIVAGLFEGGGPLESIYRIIHHMNPKVELPDTIAMSAMESIDSVWNHTLWVVQSIIPDFSVYRVAPYLANGFDVPWLTALLPSLLVTLAYLIPCLLIGYYSLSLRELESK